MSYNNIFSLKNKTIVIAGGSGQIGFEIAKGCLSFGAHVIIGDYKQIIGNLLLLAIIYQVTFPFG